MYLQIFISHSGQRLQADPNHLISPEALRQWISEKTGIPVPRQILMTAQGKNVKQQHILRETEIFVYDKQYVTGELEPPSSTNRPKPNLRRLREPPSIISDETNLQSWQELFMARRAWALEAGDIVRSGVALAQVYNDEIDVISRCVGVALDNLRNHISTLQNKFESTQKWAKDSLEDHRSALGDWRTNFDVLGQLPVRSDILGILQRPATPTKEKPSKQSPEVTLQDLVDFERLESGENDLTEAVSAFEHQLRTLEDEVHSLLRDATEVEKYGQSSWDGSETAQSLLQESDTLVGRISSDYDEILRFPNNQKSVATASRRALTHTKDLLPALDSLIKEVHQLQTSSVIRRNEVSETCLKALRGVSRLESRLAMLQNRVSNLDLDTVGAEALEAINRLFQLPIVYGSTLVEAVRRTEWVKQINGELGTMQEELRSLKEDELRRRKKWAKSVGDFFTDDVENENTFLDVGLSTPENTWPEAVKDDVQAYIDDLKSLQINDAVAEVTHLMRNLDHKLRKKPFKAFKNGSVHDLNSSSVLQANGEEVKLLQDEKTRLEDRLRASDSRIRKLEDLLHRQSQVVRPTSGAFGAAPDFDRHTITPSPVSSSRPTETLSRKSSNASRRLSNQTIEEKVLVQKIVGLEAEITRLKQEAHDERRSSTESKDKMEEAESVKRDLMANFDAQKQEFDDERQLLEDEAQKLKIRIEELEDELDRMAGSRDQLRLTTEEMVAGLQAEIERLRRSSEEQSTKARNRYESLESSLTVQRERAMSLEKQLQQYREERSTLQTQNLSLANQLRDAEREQHDYLGALQAVHSNLSPNGSAPEDFKRLVRTLEILSEGSAIHMRGQEDALQLVTAENKSLAEKIANAELQVKRLETRIASEESVSASLREILARERSCIQSLETELIDERAELKSLREKFAAGETGSEALRERLAEEEKKVAELSQRAATAEAAVHNSVEEIDAMRTRLEASNRREQGLTAHLDARGARAKDLSQRLFQYNDRIIRMLEQMGYSVTRQDDKLMIQRASKVNASTQLAQLSSSEVAPSMKRTISSSSPPQHYSDASDLDTLYWMSDSDSGTESLKFQSFIAALSRLEIDATVELTTKRYKDIEMMAKKYQKDSRAYRERSHRLQSEAHDKIAYRNFKEGDLALFLPTRDQASKPWAAFNVGAPHYFLREQDVHRLQSRDYLLARISKIEERVVDLSRSLGSNRAQPDRSSVNTEASDAASLRSVDDENPFELSDGLRWYMIDASEEKPGAPTTPGLGKSTVAATNVEVKGSMGKKAEKSSAATNAANLVTKTLNKSLDSRRSSTGSKKGHTPTPSVSSAPAPPLTATNEDQARGSVVVKPSDTDLRREQPAREDAQVFEVVRKDLLLGP